MASPIRGSYDPELQMYRTDPIPNMNRLRFWRWRAEQQNKTHGPAELTFDYTSEGEPSDSGVHTDSRGFGLSVHSS